MIRIIIPVLCLIMLCGCSQKNSGKEIVNNSDNNSAIEITDVYGAGTETDVGNNLADVKQNVFDFSAVDVSVYGYTADISSDIEKDLSELLEIYKDNLAIVDSSVSMYYTRDEDSYIPNEKEKIIVIRLKNVTDVKFHEDDTVMTDVDHIIIMPEHGYIGFENKGGDVRTYGILDRDTIRDRVDSILSKYR